MRIGTQRHPRFFLFRVLCLLLVCACFSLLSCRSYSDNSSTPSNRSLSSVRQCSCKHHRHVSRYQVTYAEGVVRVSVPCQRFTVHVEGQVSADATVLGIAEGATEDDDDLQERHRPAGPPAKICTG